MAQLHVCVWNCADTLASTVCLFQSVVENFPLWLVYRAHNTHYDLIYFIVFLQQASTKLCHFNLYTDNSVIRFLSHISFRCDSLMTAVDGRNM